MGIARFAGALVVGLLIGVGAGMAQDRTPGGPADIAFWNSVKDSKNAAEIQAYIDAFPNGTFAELAKIRLRDVNKPAPAQTGALATPAPAGGSILTNDATIREVQTKLYNLNYAIGSINGRMSDETRAAIVRWQEVVKRPQTGDMDSDQLTLLRSARIPTTWGALAYAARGASGTVWNRSSRMDAERDALLECGKRGGSGCKVVAAADKACGALSFYTGTVGSTQHYGAYALVRPNQAQAIDSALTECRKQAKRSESCGVRITFCADGSHKQ